MGKAAVRRPPAAIGAALAVVALISILLPARVAAIGGVPGTRHWHPPPRTAAWQWQLQGKIDPTFKAWVYDVDGFETKQSDVRALHRHRRRAVCYLDVGSWESFRPDAGRFPRSVIGRRYEGFPNERWLDVSRFQLFAKPLEARIQMCARKRFDAVEPDNLAGWENETGFDITRADQLRFNRWIARQVHARGMAVALKNDPRQARQLVGDFDFAIVEECFQYHECGFYKPFIEDDKAVFEAEYELSPDQFCPAAEALGFSAIRKSYDLFARPWEPCDPLEPSAGRLISGPEGVTRAPKETRWDSTSTTSRPRSSRRRPAASPGSALRWKRSARRSAGTSSGSRSSPTPRRGRSWKTPRARSSSTSR